MDRHWFPAILLGASIMLALVFAVVLSPQGQELLERNPDVRDVVTPETPVNEDVYRGAVVSLLQAYAEEGDAEATYNALIALRVPVDMLNVHYELVIAMGKVMSGDKADAEARFAALKAQYSWLPL
jgi:hypothetical protein